MSAHLPILPILWPLATALVLLLVLRRSVAAQRAFSLVSLLGLVAIEVALLLWLSGGEIAVYRLGNWEAPFGILLMADRLSAIMLLLASITAVATLLFAFGDLDERRERMHFYPLFQFLLLGLNGAFLTGDIFNLFVWYEVTLIATYALLTLGSEARQLRAGLPFLALNLTGSTLFLAAAGLIYGATGTLNMAHLSVLTAAADGASAVVVQVATVLLLVVFCFKAALFPLYFWLPDGYPAPPAAISAFFGGVATKVGVYSMMRVFPLVFPEQRALVGEGLMALGAVSMLVGVWGAVCQTEIRRLLSFHIVSQIGYLAFALGLLTEAGVAAAIFYMIHYTLVKCGLFLVAGVMERMTGQNSVKKIGGLMESAPALAALFFVAGLSLAGLPPWSGFFAKIVVVVAGFQQERYLYTGIAVLTGLFTLFSMMKIWHLSFWGEPAGERRPVPRVMYGAVALLVACSVIFAAVFQPVHAFARQTAAQLLAPDNYVRAVLWEGR
ncbi:MAG: Na(+)/H(+) antiporter subunit D [Verrucomicrobiae bacterium]|nr:Na(+)/H(+) antiporter subunit D [Verrucomicrobiae bacterium]